MDLIICRFLQLRKQEVVLPLETILVCYRKQMSIRSFASGSCNGFSQYLVSYSIQPFSTGEELCRSIGAEVASLHSHEDSSAVATLLAQIGALKNSFIGLVNNSDLSTATPFPGSFYWLDGTDFNFGLEPEKAPWISIQPESYNPSCIA